MEFSEELIHFVWKYRLYHNHRLCTTRGEALEIISVGVRNRDSGPDFDQAKIRIGGTLWAGTVEIHRNASDWNHHAHSADRAYNNVILHVVYEEDVAVYRADGSSIPTLALKPLIPEDFIFRYRNLMENFNWIPCETHLESVAQVFVSGWLSRMLLERLEERSLQLTKLLEQTKGSWEECLYIMLARNFGFHVNALPFELLARSLPRTVVYRQKDRPAAIEALVFGQAGFLSAPPVDEYQGILQAEYRYLQKKHCLTPLEPFVWKFLRLRPNNFPTVRLAQFAALLSRSEQLFSQVLNIRSAGDGYHLFQDLPVNDYWRRHFLFGKAVPVKSGQMGRSSVCNILVNTVALFLFYYGKQIGSHNFVSRSVALLESLPFETNNITTRFNKLGVNGGGAETSQALLQMKKNYCDRKRCLDCGIGLKLLKHD